MAVLVTGGAGYIGSVIVEVLESQGEHVVVLDNLSRGHPVAVKPGVPLYVGDIGDSALVDRILREHGIEACIHLAAYAYVEESVRDPALYFENNVQQGIALLNSLLRGNVKRVVFSSSCAVYGKALTTPVDELHPRQPCSPYGLSKVLIEQALEAYDSAYGFRFVALRYFNAAGATAKNGEMHDPETHLIPNVLAAAAGELPYLSVFCNRLDGRDGTPVRDYVHVSDLASGHILALNYLRSGGKSEFINLGTGRGHSVLDIVRAVEESINAKVQVRYWPARTGDPPRLIADASKAAQVLGWKPEHEALLTIIQSAWHWHHVAKAQARPGSLTA